MGSLEPIVSFKPTTDEHPPFYRKTCVDTWISKSPLNEGLTCLALRTKGGKRFSALEIVPSQEHNYNYGKNDCKHDQILLFSKITISKSVKSA